MQTFFVTMQFCSQWRTSVPFSPFSPLGPSCPGSPMMPCCPFWPNVKENSRHILQWHLCLILLFSPMFPKLLLRNLRVHIFAPSQRPTQVFGVLDWLGAGSEPKYGLSGVLEDWIGKPRFSICIIFFLVYSRLSVRKRWKVLKISFDWMAKRVFIAWLFVLPGTHYQKISVRIKTSWTGNYFMQRWAYFTFVPLWTKVSHLSLLPWGAWRASDVTMCWKMCKVRISHDTLKELQRCDRQCGFVSTIII